MLKEKVFKQNDYLGDRLDNFHNVCILGATDEFTSVFNKKTNIHKSITDEKKYDAIFVVNDNITHGDIKKYSNNLTKNGLLVVLSLNKRFLYLKPNFLRSNNLNPILMEPIGNLIKIHRLASDGFLNKKLLKFGKIMPNFKIYSPYCLLILESSTRTVKYVSRYTIRSRVNRIINYRFILNAIRSLMVQALTPSFLFIENKTGLFNHKFKKHILPLIPIREKPKNKKMVFISMTYFAMGGVERVMLNIIKGLDRNKLSIHLVTTEFSDNPWENKFKPYVDSIIHTPDYFFNNRSRYYVGQRFLEEYLILNKADVLLTTNSLVTYRALPKIKKSLPHIKIFDILHTHGTPQEDDAFLKSSMSFDNFIDKRIVISEYLKKYYTNKYPVSPEKIEVIYNGIDFMPEESKIILKKDSIFDSIDPDFKKITYIGRLEKDKSPLRLVKIAKTLQERKAKVCIVIVGEGSMKRSVIKQIKELRVTNSYLRLHEPTNDPLGIAKRSDYTILVSDSEGIPMAILEAMSVSTPVIASSVGGVPEIIENGIDGYLVDINSVSTEQEKIMLFINAIQSAAKLSKKEYLDMSNQSQQKIKAKFTSMSSNYNDLLCD